MPIYEYACGKCEHEFEVEQRMSDPPVKTCPKCRSRKVKRLISRTSFVLKGSGWYSDLYSSSRKSDKGEGKREGEGKGATEKEGSKKSKDSGGSKDTKASGGSKAAA